MEIRRLRGAREAPLFSALPSPPEGEAIVSGDGDVRLYRAWLGRDRADALLASIRATTVWTQERRRMYDRTVDVPREQALFGEGSSSSPLPAGPMSAELDAVRAELEGSIGVRFPVVLLNRYRDGADSVAWHSDREIAGILRPAIASLTLGVTRAFDLRPKAERSRVTSIDLDHGDLLVMHGDTQINYEHRVRKDPRIRGERINLTFRERRDGAPQSA